MLALSKPWIDLEKYKRDRLKEALYEAEVAEEFLKNGLLSNAAGKAFQAVKAYLAAVAAGHREKILEAFPGEHRLGPDKAVARGDWIIAVMPKSRMRTVAALIGDKELRLAVEIALNLHEFQYNGLDQDAEVSRYSGEDEVRRDVEEVIAYVKKWASSQLPSP